MTLELRLILLCTVLGAIAAGGWYVVHLIRQNEIQAAALEQWQHNYTALDVLWKTEREARAHRDSDYRAAEQRAVTLGKQLKEALSHDSQTRPCLRAPVGRATDERMRDIFNAQVSATLPGDHAPDAAP